MQVVCSWEQTTRLHRRTTSKRHQQRFTVIPSKNKTTFDFWSFFCFWSMEVPSSWDALRKQVPNFLFLCFLFSDYASGYVGNDACIIRVLQVSIFFLWGFFILSVMGNSWDGDLPFFLSVLWIWFDLSSCRFTAVYWWIQL